MRPSIPLWPRAEWYLVYQHGVVDALGNGGLSEVIRQTSDANL